uniref:Uncharacterized protein n=1 Tax=Nelumbo nucifera TaxID=4432 RepID=A0A822XYJ2_NELNU|nr:TPA_asm: hypothetical protein HUJ06_028162 [Nelumbo nucifera]
MLAFVISFQLSEGPRFGAFPPCAEIGPVTLSTMTTSRQIAIRDVFPLSGFPTNSRTDSIQNPQPLSVARPSFRAWAKLTSYEAGHSGSSAFCCDTSKATYVNQN